jgi:hypothetical protein
MSVHTRCRSAQLPFLLGAIALLTACVTSGRPPLGPRSLGSAAADVMTEAEIAESHASTAYEAIQLSHPLFLMSKIDVGPLAQRDVYLDGMHLGGIAELRGIPAGSVREIRFVRALDAAASGIGRSGGAILVISKAGP